MSSINIEWKARSNLTLQASSQVRLGAHARIADTLVDDVLKETRIDFDILDAVLKHFIAVGSEVFEFNLVV
jgi:hypothetical protein